MQLPDLFRQPVLTVSMSASYLCMQVAAQTLSDHHAVLTIMGNIH